MNDPKDFTDWLAATVGEGACTFGDDPHRIRRHLADRLGMLSPDDRQRIDDTLRLMASASSNNRPV